jgi:hypothetical protein
MSETVADTMGLQAVIAQIDRDIARSARLREETENFVAEQHRLLAEQRGLPVQSDEANRLSCSLPANRASRW